MPIDATTGRHGRGPTVEVWSCPRCNAEQVGPIGECHACGSGTQKAYHVETPPLPPPTLPPLPEPGTLEFLVRPRDDRMPFDIWADAQGYRGGTRTVAKKAWEAALDWMTKGTPAAFLTPAVEAGPTAEARTVIAALEKFIADVLIFDPDEVETGEWLSSTATNMLIMRLRKGESL